MLRWTASSEGVTLRVEHDDGILPSGWALLTLETEGGSPARVGAALRALDDGEALEGTDGSLLLPTQTVVGLSVEDAHGLGLPPRLDWPMVVRMEGTVEDPDSLASFHFEGSRGRPLHSGSRRGAIAAIDGKDFRYSPSVFRAVEALEAYNATKGASPPVRLLAWGRVSDCLPDEVRAEPYLTETRTCEAVAFSLQPFINERGEADFDPVPGVWVAHVSEEGEPATSFEARLPDGPVERFQTAVRKAGSRERFSLGGGWYLSIDENALPVLQALQEIQRAEPAVRLSFLRNPVAVLRQRLPEASEEVIARAFASEDYSQRVQGTAIWKPPVLPWVRKEPERWLPDERLGVRIGDEFVGVAPEDVARLIHDLQAAKNSGKPGVEYKGKVVPATDEAIEALRHLNGTERPGPAGPGGGQTDAEERVRLILEVVENFEDVSYTQGGRQRTRTGVAELDPSKLGLRNTPLPHQVNAIAWLQAHWLMGSPGALLADDMGLGKTFQALAFMAWMRREMNASRIPQRPFLVVAPTGLLENWAQEQAAHLSGEGLGELVRAFGPELKSLRRGHGSEDEAGVPLLDLQRIRQAGWVLTTYETFRDYQHSLGKVHFALAALDETQKAKNPASGISQAMKAVHADFMLCITGTPVENRLADLWNILDVARPGDLGSLKEFSKKFEAPAVGQAPLELLQEHLTDSQPSIMLRRMKGDHLKGLPPKECHFPELEMPPLQRRAYTQILEEAHSSQIGEQGGMLAILGRMRSTSLHPFVQTSESDEEYIQSSARLILTFRELDKVQSLGEKVLIFLESREMQGTLASLIQRRYRTANRPMIINGSVAGPARQERVRRFQKEEGFDALILSPKAGGVGLTLTAANHVIHLSRWWNPAVEDQCTDRVYRIGQGRPVHIYHPIAKHPDLEGGSFDHVLDRLLKRKRELSRAVLAPTTLSKDEVAKLFEDVLGAPIGSPADPIFDEREIAILSPVQFEKWVLDRFRGAGYTVQETPQSSDAGVDGIARPPSGIAAPTVLIQVKHTQVGAPCPPDGVIELVEGYHRYPAAGPRELVLVTNAPGFTARARVLAEENGVRLFALERLNQVEGSYRLKRPPDRPPPTHPSSEFRH